MYNKEYLFKKYLAGKCTTEEATFLIAAFSEEEFCAQLSKYVDEVLQEELSEEERIAALDQLSEEQYPNVEALIFHKTSSPRASGLLRRIAAWTAVAAAILLFFVGQRLFVAAPVVESDVRQMTASSAKDAGENDGITLTLESGEVVDLSADMETTYASTEKKNGNSFFEIKKLTAVTESMFQTVNVPAGKTGALLLTDGTKVWLNANSRLTYDVNFIGGVRKVKLEGEAYFEVAANKEKPFIVASKDQQIRVLGTHFNIKAYAGSRTTTTLMEGRVEVATPTRAQVLNPGESSIVTLGGGDLSVAPARFDRVNAWRNNAFAFFDASLIQIGQELSRWYGVEVQVVGSVAGYGFTGDISRDRKLEDVLEILNRTGQIRFHIIPIGLTERRVLLMQ